MCASDDASPGKRRRRALRFIGLNQLSDSGIAAVMSEMAASPGEPLSRFQLGRAANKENKKFGYSIPLQMVTGAIFTWHLLRVDLVLQYAIEECPNFKDLMIAAAASVGTEAILHLIFYLDEVHPGNILNTDAGRKFWAFYFSIREFGRRALMHDECWLPIGILRTSIVKKIKGGLSACVRQLFRSWFLGSPLRLSTDGVFLQLVRVQLLFLHFGNFVADLDAFKKTWDIKGSGSTKPCLKCANVVHRRHRLRRPGLVFIDCCDKSKFLQLTGEEFYKLVDRVAAAVGTMTKADLKRLERATGINYNPDGVIFDP